MGDPVIIGINNPDLIIRVIPSAPDYGATENGDIIRLAPGKSTWPGRRLVPVSNMSRPNREKRGEDGGYLRCQVKLTDGARRGVMVHRLVCEAFHGPPPTLLHPVAHENGVRTDNRPDNLAWKTALENAADKRRHGTQPFGEQCNGSKLKIADVRHL